MGDFPFCSPRCKAVDLSHWLDGGYQPVLDSAGGKHSIFTTAFLDTLGNNREILTGPQLTQWTPVQTRNTSDSHKGT